MATSCKKEPYLGDQEEEKLKSIISETCKRFNHIGGRENLKKLLSNYKEHYKISKLEKKEERECRLVLMKDFNAKSEESLTPLKHLNADNVDMSQVKVKKFTFTSPNFCEEHFSQNPNKLKDLYEVAKNYGKIVDNIHTSKPYKDFLDTNIKKFDHYVKDKSRKIEEVTFNDQVKSMTESLYDLQDNESYESRLNFLHKYINWRYRPIQNDQSRKKYKIRDAAQNLKTKIIFCSQIKDEDKKDNEK